MQTTRLMKTVLCAAALLAVHAAPAAAANPAALDVQATRASAAPEDSRLSPKLLAAQIQEASKLARTETLMGVRIVSLPRSAVDLAARAELGAVLYGVAAHAQPEPARRARMLGLLKGVSKDASLRAALELPPVGFLDDVQPDSVLFRDENGSVRAVVVIGADEDAGPLLSAKEFLPAHDLVPAFLPDPVLLSRWRELVEFGMAVEGDLRAFDEFTALGVRSMAEAYASLRLGAEFGVSRALPVLSWIRDVRLAGTYLPAVKGRELTAGAVQAAVSRLESNAPLPSGDALLEEAERLAFTSLPAPRDAGLLSYWRQDLFQAAAASGQGTTWSVSIRLRPVRDEGEDGAGEDGVFPLAPSNAPATVGVPNGLVFEANGGMRRSARPVSAEWVSALESEWSAKAAAFPDRAGRVGELYAQGLVDAKIAACAAARGEDPNRFLRPFR